jgi:septum formation protein
MHLVLASASPRRAELLRAAGFTFDTIVADVDERVRAGESASDYVRRLAAEKSGTAQVRLQAGLKACTTGDAGVVQAFRPAVTDATILGADTAVVVDGDILGKPRDDRDAERMLRRLSGRTHEVMTGVSLRRGDLEVGRAQRTRVEVAALSDAEIAWYLASGEGRDKAGAYAIQGLASRFIPRIDGSYSNVVGLPVACVVELLASLGERGYSDSSHFPRKSL